MTQTVPRSCSTLGFAGAFALGWALPMVAHALPDDAPVETASALHAWVLANPAAPVPGGTARETLAAWLTPELIATLERAEDVQLSCIASAKPDEKPLLIEGDLFVGTAEGAHEVAFDSVRIDGSHARLGVYLIYIDTRFAKAHRFRTVVTRNELLMKKSEAGWRVEDIRYGNGETLLAWLEGYVSEGKRDCAVN